MEASHDGNVYQLRISDDRMYLFPIIYGHQKDNVRCVPSLVTLAHLNLSVSSGGKLTIFKTIAVDASILKAKLLNSFYWLSWQRIRYPVRQCTIS